MKHQSLTGIQTLISIFCLLIASAAHTQAQPQPYNVAILLYEGVELLDFAGPGEVFGASSGFKVYTVTADGNPILSQRFVTVNPQYSIATAPPADILIFPGGGSAAPSKNPVVINWVKTRVENGATVMSVCTGAEILAKAGLLENLNVTTFHGFISGLQSMLPNSKVLTNTRYVDNGHIITTAGVSAGIDGALHLLGRIKGLDVAKATAFYMEYDNWKSEQGKIDYQNPYIMELLAAVNQPEKSITTSLKDIPKGKLPFEGEFKNLASSVKENGNTKGAAKILELAKEAYPYSQSVQNELAKLYKELGKPSPLDPSGLADLLRKGTPDEALAAIEKDRKNFPGWNLTTENSLNIEGYHQLQDQDIATAIKVFELNTLLFPKSGNTFDSLGEAYLIAGNKKAAAASYKKAVELDPKNSNAQRVLEELGQE